MSDAMGVTHKTSALVFEDLGRMRYAPALELQREIHRRVLDGSRPPTVLLLEHEAVITLSKREGVGAHLLADAARLRREGVEVCRTDRGGDITYHGPGQLVAYPILPLNRYKLNVRQHVRLLESIVIETIGRFGIEGHRDSCAAGVWVGRSGDNDRVEGGCEGGGAAKIAAVGVRVARWVSMHGVALNVSTNLGHFGLIVPCGLRRPVTSMRRELGGGAPSIGRVKEVLRQGLARRLRDMDSERGR